jgi:hypothetical protein
LPTPPITDGKRFFAAVLGPLVGQRRRAGRCVAILNPLLKFLGRAGADVGGEVRLDAAQTAEAHKFVGAEVVRLGDFFPASEAARPLVARSDAVAPVVLVGEAAARPPHHHAAQPPYMLDQAAANSVNVGHFRLWADPDAVVDDAADVLGEVAVNRRLDRADGVIESHSDGHLGATLAAWTAPRTKVSNRPHRRKGRYFLDCAAP